MATTSHQGYYQLGYTTDDIDRGMREVGAVHGIREWLTIKDYRVPLRGGATVTVHLAMAYAGPTNVEVIQPVAGEVDLYRATWTRERDVVSFHHVCRLFEQRDDYEAHLQLLQEQEVPIPLQVAVRADGGGSRCSFADYRDTLGHFIELVWFDEAGRERLRSVPRN